MHLRHWESKEKELDFVEYENRLIEVKRGRAGPLDYSWFPRVFPKSHLTVVTQSPFETAFGRGMTMSAFLREEDLA